MDNHKERLLWDIGVVSFTLVELALYLDTHPHDLSAMGKYDHYEHIRKEMMKEFAFKYYPLTLDMADSAVKWRWGDAPLPWDNNMCEGGRDHVEL